jgi:hypothetical protein
MWGCLIVAVCALCIAWDREERERARAFNLSLRLPERHALTNKLQCHQVFVHATEQWDTVGGVQKV